MLLDFFQNQDLNTLVISAVVMVIALMFHNVFQAWVASRYGDNGPRFSGYMSFDPQQQLEPIGVVFLFLLGFGWPRAIPTNSRNYRGRGRQEAIVWYSGPLAYLIIAFLCYLAYAIFFRVGQQSLANAFSATGGIAILHAVINLFPVYPLDGAKAALAWGNAGVRRVVQQIASYGFIGFILIFLVLSATGILGNIIVFFRTIILIILGFIPGL